MKKHLCTAICTVFFAALILTGCTGNRSTAAASGKDYTQQQTQGQIADAADRTRSPEESAVPSEGVTETSGEGQTEKETEGQTVVNEAQTDKKSGTMTEGEQQTKPQPPKKGTTTTTPGTEAPEETPVQSTPKPVTPVSPETPAETKAPAQTQKPVTPVQPETKAPAQTQKPSTPAQPETKAPVQMPKPTAPAQPETQVPTKAPEQPKKEKTMWYAPYDVEAIRDYIAKELISRGYTDVDDFEAYKKRVKELWNTDASMEDWKEMIECGYTHPMDEWGSGAWSSETTATAGTPRYYDTANNCTVGHLHYKWAEPHTGGGALRNEDGRLTLQAMLDEAINFWDVIYGHNAIGDDFNGGYGAEFFKIYIEKFDDGCVIFYIIM